MEQTPRRPRNFSKQIKQQVVLTLNFLPVTTIRCRIIINLSSNGITGEEVEQVAAGEPFLVRTFQDTTILIMQVSTNSHSGQIINKMAVTIGILRKILGKITIIINKLQQQRPLLYRHSHLQRHNSSHLQCRNRTCLSPSHPVIVITREHLTTCNSAKIGQLSDRRGDHQAYHLYLIIGARA